MKLSEISFNMGEGNHRCCLAHFTQSFEKTVGEGEDAETFIPDDATAEVGTVLTCPHCHAQNILTEAGEFSWVNPHTEELVEVAA